MRQKAKDETKNRTAVEEAIKTAEIMAYLPPSHLAMRLENLGVKVSRQLVDRYYAEAGIVYNLDLGLWVKA